MTQPMPASEAARPPRKPKAKYTQRTEYRRCTECGGAGTIPAPLSSLGINICQPCGGKGRMKTVVKTKI